MKKCCVTNSPWKYAVSLTVDSVCLFPSRFFLLNLASQESLHGAWLPTPPKVSWLIQIYSCSCGCGPALFFLLNVCLIFTHLPKFEPAPWLQHSWILDGAITPSRDGYYIRTWQAVRAIFIPLAPLSRLGNIPSPLPAFLYSNFESTVI